jgi:hypothetical protein
MYREYFTQAQAEELVGKCIRTLTAWSGVSRNTTGTVIHADQTCSGWTVAIQWDLPSEPLQVCMVQFGNELVVIVTGGSPLVDWFSRDEYERHLVSIDVEESSEDLS